MPQIPTQIDAELEGGLSRGLVIPQGGAEAFDRAGRHVAQQLRVATEGVANVANAVEQHEAQTDNAKTMGQENLAYGAIDDSLAKKLNGADPTQAHDIVDAWLRDEAPGVINPVGADARTNESRRSALEAQQRLSQYARRSSATDVSHVVGTFVHDSFVEATNGVSQRAYLGTVPLNDAQAQIDSMAKDAIGADAPRGLSPSDAANLSDTIALEAHKKVDVAAARGMAENNPVAFGEAAASGKFKFLNGDELSQIGNYGNTQARAGRAAYEKQQKDDFGANSVAITRSMMGTDGLLHPSPDATKAIYDLGSHPGAALDPGRYDALVKMNETVTRDRAEGKTTVSDPSIYDHFTNQMAAGTLSTADIDLARAGHKLSDHDYSALRAGAEDAEKDPVRRDAYKQFGSFLGTVKSQFVTKGGLLSLQTSDPRDQQRWYNFEHDARAAFDQAYTDKTWKTLLDPHNGAFLGRMAAQQILNKKGAPWSAELFGTIQSGYRFTGHTPQEWNDKSKWIKQ